MNEITKHSLSQSMNMLFHSRSTRVLLAAICIGAPTIGDNAFGQDTADQPAVASSSDRDVAPETVTPSTGNLKFNFSGANWKDVLTWFAGESDLSLQIDQTPVGTVNFKDPSRTYDVAEGLDLINRLLLDRGWALVRRGRMLLLIDLEEENADKLIDAQAELVSVEELDRRGNSDIVKCVFPLGSVSAEAAVEELAQLIGPWGRVKVLGSAKQVVVTETVGNLKTIRDLLQSATLAVSNVVEIRLQYRTADELLEIARPLLELEDGENSNDKIRISIGPYGDRMFATGDTGSLSLLEGLIGKADTPLELADAGDAGEVALPILVTHSISVADATTVFDVLQTLLAGTPDARISVDPKTNAIIAYARPETQEMVKLTIAELEGNGAEFEVIDLKRLDPSQALLTINKFFGVTEEGGEGPIVDGDPVTNRLWVKGTKGEIDMVKALIADLEDDDSLDFLGENVRILPYTGQAAEDALTQMETLWQMTGRKNEIRVVSPSRSQSSGGSGIPERRRPADDSDSQQAPTGNSSSNPFPQTRNNVGSDYRFVTQVGADAAEETVMPGKPAEGGPAQKVNINGAEIVIQFTQAGMVVASEDADALDMFEALLQSIATPSGAASDLPTIYWLKYIEADVAAELIANVMGGAESTLGSLTDSLTGGLGGMMGLVGGGGGGGDASSKSVMTATGSVSIVPDARLNALIIQANSVDLQFIDLILAKLDVQESPEDIETVAKPGLIPVIYQDASEVETLVKAVFAAKIEGAQATGGRGGGGGGGGQPSPQDFIQALRGGGRGGGGAGGGQAAVSEPAKMVVAVDARSNSLVVTATPQDFKEVRDFVEQLDQQGMESEEDVIVIPLAGGVKPEIIQAALDSMLGTQSGTATSGSTSGSGSTAGSGAPASGSSPAEIQQRIDFFRSRIGGGATGGGGPGGGRGGGGATGGRGGGGGGGGGGGRGGGGAPGGGGRF